MALLRYHIGWCYAVGQEVGAPLFHPTTLVHFRQRLLAHQQSAVAFETILKGLEDSGLLPRRRKERLDSTQVLGLLSHMSRLECCRTTLRQALEEIAKTLAEASRPAWWPTLWERYVESRFDFRSEPKVLQEKFQQTGQDGARMLAWNQGLDQKFSGRKVRLLARVWEEQFELVQPAAPAKPTGTPEAGAAPVPGAPCRVAAPTSSVPSVVVTPPEEPTALGAPSPTILPPTAPLANPPLPPAESAVSAPAPTLQPKRPPGRSRP